MTTPEPDPHYVLWDLPQEVVERSPEPASAEESRQRRLDLTRDELLLQQQLHHIENREMMVTTRLVLALVIVIGWTVIAVLIVYGGLVHVFPPEMVTGVMSVFAALTASIGVYYFRPHHGDSTPGGSA